MTSAAEADTAQDYNNIKSFIPIHRTLTEMNHDKCGPTPLKTDNKTTEGFEKSSIYQKHYKAWGMKFHKIKD